LGLAVGEALYAPHAGDKWERLEVVRLIHEQLVDAQVLEVDGLVGLSCYLVLERTEFLLHLHDAVLDVLVRRVLDRPVLPFLLCECRAVVVNLGLKERPLRYGLQRQFLKLLIGDDHRIPVACGDARHELRALFGRKVLLRWEQDMRVGVQVKELVPELRMGRLRYDKQVLAGKAQAP